jgi:hypothetical protein
MEKICAKMEPKISKTSKLRREEICLDLLEISGNLKSTRTSDNTRVFQCGPKNKTLSFHNKQFIKHFVSSFGMFTAGI